jgi:tRNA(fMet)-specific endonuclease VapC
MRGYTLDSDHVRALLRSDPQYLQRQRVALDQSLPVLLNAISYFETRRGLLYINARGKLGRIDAIVRQSDMAFLNKTALDIAADLHAELRGRGELIEDADLLMAAIALAHDLTLLTANTRHFQRIEFLRIENWIAS